MMNKALLLTVCGFISLNIGAQLPDEINYTPYYENYVDIKNDRDAVSSELTYAENNLASLLESIKEFEDHIVVLETQIYDYQKRIAYVENLLPQRQNELNQKENELNSTRNRLAKLRKRRANVQNQVSHRRQDLRPIQREIGKKESKLRSLQQRLQSTRRELRSDQSTKSKLQSKISTLTSNIRSLKSQIESLKKKKQTLSQEISSLKSLKSKFQSQKENKEAQLVKTKRQVNALKSRLSKEQNKLRDLISSNADSSAIAKQKRKISSIKNTLNEKKSAISSLKRTISTLKSKMSNTQRKIQSTKSTLSAIPGKIGQKQSRIRSHRSSISTTRTKLESVTRQVASLERQIENIKQAKLRTNREISSLEQDESRIQDKIRMLTGRLQNIDGNIASNESLRNGLMNTIAHLNDEIRDIQNEVPELRRSISVNRTDISTSRNSIASLKRDEQSVRNQITQLEKDLSLLQRQTNEAYAQYDKRQDLYDYHLNKAQKLGQSQTDPAISLGTDKGLELAQRISDDNSKQIAGEYGRFFAQMIGTVRGENAGYAKGYQAGYTNEDSIHAGVKEGNLAGVNASVKYAQTILKPQFFEQHLMAQFQTPLKESVSMKMAGTQKLNFLEPELFENEISDLTQAEIKISFNLKTSLDRKIKRLLADRSQVHAKYEKYSQAQFSYIKPQSIPYQKVQCDQVYKGVTEYKTACQKAYNKLFSQLYLNNSYEEYKAQYKTMYLDKFSVLEPKIRFNSYNEFHTSAFDLAYAEAEIKGKKDIYDQTFEENFQIGYDTNLPIATNEADQVAKNELEDWAKKHPLVTGSRIEFSSQNLRGGKKGFIVLSLKNISNVTSKSTGELKILESKNLKFTQTSWRLINLEAKSMKEMKIPFNVKADAASGEIIKLKTQLILPGDKYKSIRKEVLSIEQVLVKNPKFDLNLAYDKTPKVKGLWNYYIHTFKLNIKPTVESLASGYSVILKPLEGAGKLMNIKVSSAQTGALTQNEQKEIDLSYIFKKRAKGKTVKLNLEIKYKGEVLTQKVIELHPR